MDAIELLKTRASNGKLTDPAPDANTLRLALEAAARSPDHAGLRPWRVRFIRGQARERFGELMASAAARANPQAKADELDKTRRKPLRAPLLIVVGAVVRSHPKVPDVEQILAAGAAAHAILLTLQARGYAAIWRTGEPAYDPEIKRAFGWNESDAIVAILYAGTAKVPAPNLARPAPEDFAAEWTG
jgi:nitroreductase